MKIPKDSVSFNEDIHIIVSKEGKNINKIKNKDLYWILVKKLQQQQQLWKSYNKNWILKRKSGKPYL